MRAVCVEYSAVVTWDARAAGSGYGVYPRHYIVEGFGKWILSTLGGLST